MKKNSYVKELLERHPKIFRKLHFETGIDFEKEFVIKKHIGSFTINSIMKNLSKFNSMTMDDTKVVLICGWQGTRVLKTVYPYDNKNFSITSHWNVPYTKRKEFTSDNSGGAFWTKGDFNDMRKEEDVECYVIAQKKEYITITKGTPSTHFGIESYERLVVKGDNLYKADGGEFVDGWKGDLDKSGYLALGYQRLCDIISENKRAKAKAEYEKHDFTPKAEALNSMLNVLKMDFATVMTNVNDRWEVEKLGNLLRDYKGLGHLISDVKWFTEKTTKKEYRSIEESEKEYTSILNNITELTTKVQEVIKVA